MALKNKVYSDNGVEISKEKIYVGDKVTITYDGLLAKSGADSVLVHIGYGEVWEDKLFVPMELVDGIFKATIKVSQSKDLNISFKDSAENWDNNSSSNYTFKVSEKAKTSKKDDEEKALKKSTKTAGAVKAEVKKAVAKKAEAKKPEAKKPEAKKPEPKKRRN